MNAYEALEVPCYLVEVDVVWVVYGHGDLVAVSHHCSPPDATHGHAQRLSSDMSRLSGIRSCEASLTPCWRLTSGTMGSYMSRSQPVGTSHSSLIHNQVLARRQLPYALQRSI